MTQEEARQHIADAVAKTLHGRAAKLNDDTELMTDKVLDSLDCMVFIEELASATGKPFPEDLNLSKAGLYKVGNLVSYLTS